MPTSLQETIKRDSWYGAKPLIASLMKAPGINSLVHLAGTAVLPPSMRYRLPVAARQSHYRLRSGETVILLNPDQDQVAKDMYWGGGAPTAARDRNILAAVERLAQRADLFVDIGTYSGLFALIALKANPALRAIAFEVLPENFLATIRNLVENEVLDRADVRRCGIAGRHGSIIMSRQIYSASRPSSVSLAADFDNGVSIPIIPLDSLNLGSKMVWKIDVEGFEWNVLQGAQETVHRAKPEIICEILPGSEHAADIERLLRPLGYRFFVATDRGLEERPDLRPDADGRDWLFTRNPLP